MVPLRPGPRLSHARRSLRGPHTLPRIPTQPRTKALARPSLLPSHAYMSVPSSSVRAGPAMAPALAVVLLAPLLGLQPITTDLYLPALPALQQHLGASMPQAQLMLTALLLALARRHGGSA